MRILHLSDFHLDKKDKDETITHIVRPLLATLEDSQKENPVDLVLITGDLINIGGEDYDSIEQAFTDFTEVLVNPILEKTGLKKDRVFFVAGNHDILRKADSKIIEKGLEGTLIS